MVFGNICYVHSLDCNIFVYNGLDGESSIIVILGLT